MTAKIKEIAVYTENTKEVFIQMFVNDEKTCSKKMYSESYYEMSESDKEICKSIGPFDFAGITKVISEYNFNGSKVCDWVKSFGWDSNIEDSLLMGLEDEEDEKEKNNKISCKELREIMLSEWQRFHKMTVEQVKNYIKYNFICSKYALKTLSREFAGK